MRCSTKWSSIRRHIGRTLGRSGAPGLRYRFWDLFKVSKGFGSSCLPVYGQEKCLGGGGPGGVIRSKNIKVQVSGVQVSGVQVRPR